MSIIAVRKVTDRYNTRIPAEGLDFLGIKEGEMYEVEQGEKVLIIRKFSREATA